MKFADTANTVQVIKQPSMCQQQITCLDGWPLNGPKTQHTGAYEALTTL